MSQSNPGKGGSSNASGSNKSGNTANRPSAGKPPANRAGASGSKGATGSRPAQQGSAANRNNAARPGVKRAQPAPPPTGFRAQMDSALPPFSARRYVAIWGAFMVVAIIAILLLWRPWNNLGTGSAALPAATVAGGTTGSGACDAPTAAGKYMVIDTVKGCIVAKLYTDASAGVAKTVANFEQKANANYFNGLIFHRVEDWVIQGGDPLGTGMGGGSMPSEYNKLTFKAGSLGVARGGNPAINNDSQFFITKTAYPSLDGQYTNFGEVVTGMDVVSKIAIGDKMNKVSVVNR